MANVAQSRVTTGVGVATLLRTATELHEDVFVSNRGTAAIFLGGSDVATTTGYELTNATALSDPVRLDKGQSLYAISAAAQRVDLLIVPTGEIGGD